MSWAVGDEPKSPSPNDIITFVTLPLTVVAIFYAKKAFNAQKEALEHQQVLGAWSLLASEFSGNLGKKEALETLSKNGGELINIPPLQGVHLEGLTLYGTKIVKIHFMNSTHLRKAKLIDCIIEKAWFSDVDMGLSEFHRSKLKSVEFARATLGKSKFIDVKFRGYTLFDCCALSAGTNFTGAQNIERVEFKNCYTSGKDKLPTAPEGWKFEFEMKKGKQRIGMRARSGVWEKRYYIKLIKTETKKT